MSNSTPYTVRPTQFETRERETLEWLQARNRRRPSRIRLALPAWLGRRSGTPQTAR